MSAPAAVIASWSIASSCELPTASGVLECRVYSRGGEEAVALVARARHGGGAGAAPSAVSARVASVSARVPSRGVVLRVQDACVTSEVFGSIKCDCASQLSFSLALLHTRAVVAASAGADGDTIAGVVCYLMQEGRGIGLAAKVAAYALQDGARALDTVDANRALGLPDDARDYGVVVDILDDLGLRAGAGAREALGAGTATGGGGAAALPTPLLETPQLLLLTNNPRKTERLQALGVDLGERLPCLLPPVGPLAASYLRTKATRMGHDIPQDFWEFGQ